MQIERPHPKIGALVTGVDVRSLSDDQWTTLYRTWLDSVVMVRASAVTSRYSAPESPRICSSTFSVKGKRNSQNVRATWRT